MPRFVVIERTPGEHGPVREALTAETLQELAAKAHELWEDEVIAECWTRALHEAAAACHRAKAEAASRLGIADVNAVPVARWVGAFRSGLEQATAADAPHVVNGGK